MTVNRNWWLNVLLALAAGFAGARLDRLLTTPQQQIRARGFELIDAQGNTAGLWGVSESGDVAIRLRSRNVNSPIGETEQRSAPQELAVFGIFAGSPTIEFKGADLKPRMVLSNNQFDRPALMMADEIRYQVLLGADTGDTPRPEYRNWILAFGEHFARIGMHEIVENGKPVWRGELNVNHHALP
jgi:hypothetical protein